MPGSISHAKWVWEPEGREAPELSGKMMDRAVQEGRGGPLRPPGSELSLQRDEGHGVLRELLLINIREK